MDHNHHHRHYHNHNAHAGPSRPHHDVEAIPAPVPKASYEAPVFRTFQDRKRAKELAMRQEFQPVSAPSPPESAQSRPLPRPASVSPLPLITTPDGPLYPTPLPRSPVQATMERSDTVSSIRSLDRVGFSSGRRPLPQPPVGVNVSRSLDRGVPVGISRRKQPSTVAEEDETSNYSSRTTTPIPTINGPLINSPNFDGGGSPGNAPVLNLPTFNFDEPDDQPRDNIVMTGLPVISVSSESQPTRIQTDGAILCSGCGEPIIGRIVNAMKNRFHPACFRCEECGEHLEHVSSYEWEGRAYCHLDYHDKFAHRCHHCKTPIVDPRFVTLHDESLGQRYYHELHFFCSECGDPFLDPSKSSAPGANGNDEDVETNAFVVHRGHPYCEKCHLRLHKPKCRACSQPIPDVAVNALGAKWHQACFRCSRQLSNLFFPQDGCALCTECFEMHGQNA